MDKKKIGFAVIGYGGMGSWHASRMEQFKDTAELIGIYDINPERRALAEERGIHAFSSREELLADERIDLVTVATPNDGLCCISFWLRSFPIRTIPGCVMPMQCP